MSITWPVPTLLTPRLWKNTYIICHLLFHSIYFEAIKLDSKMNIPKYSYSFYQTFFSVELKQYYSVCVCSVNCQLNAVSSKNQYLWHVSFKTVFSKNMLRYWSIVVWNDKCFFFCYLLRKWLKFNSYLCNRVISS